VPHSTIGSFLAVAQEQEIGAKGMHQIQLAFWARALFDPSRQQRVSVAPRERDDWKRLRIFVSAAYLETHLS